MSEDEPSPLNPEPTEPLLNGEGLPPLPEWERLDPLAVSLWRMGHLIGSAVLLGLALIPAVGIAVAAPGSLTWVAGGWLALALLRLFLLWWHPRRSYQEWAYRLDDRVLETRSGIWFKVEQLLPLSRLQHADLQRGPLERYFGLASLVLHTAGSQLPAIVIPGLRAEVAEQLRDRLVLVGGEDGV